MPVAEHAVIGSLGRRSTLPPSTSLYLICGLFSFSITDVLIGSLLVLRYSLLFTTVAIYLHTLVCSIRIAPSALLSFCHVSLVLHRPPLARTHKLVLFPPIQLSNQRSIISKTDTLPPHSFQVPFLSGASCTVAMLDTFPLMSNAFVW
ncbi:hypothetical protein L210DRAFT_2109791 [Boletus edulis BED1]|uniref:Uncharacterized protein n=1 Tax=Boletus edulis BED1 TaxID=1328754 RepID=A0AAD4BEZ5_BOLED|nr:hypothetical protein L210DRAFT_2109791 [Boletus edulis BED1]